MTSCDIAIIGAGVMGAAAACEAARDGAQVTLIDESSLPNPRAASVDHSKVFRFAYPDPLYAGLAIDALSRWRALEEQTGARLLTSTGVLMLGNRLNSVERETHDALRSLNLEVELLDGQSTASRFPQFNGDAFPYGVYDPGGAILHAETALRGLIDLARRRGVTIIEAERITQIKQGAHARVSLTSESGSEFDCGRVGVASGPWTRALLLFLSDKLTATRQEVAYFEPVNSQLSFEPGRFPIFIEMVSGFYGFPIHHRGAMKVANHHKGEQVEPYSFQAQVTDEFISRCRAFFAEFIPGLSGARVRETRVCLYNNTPDDDFIIDWHPELENVLIVSGFSGHGFKFGPTIGRISADLLISGRTSFNTERFSLSRFNKR